jgi:hypothetical protein
VDTPEEVKEDDSDKELKISELEAEVAELTEGYRGIESELVKAKMEWANLDMEND